MRCKKRITLSTDENETMAAPKAHETPLLGASHLGGLPDFYEFTSVSQQREFEKTNTLMQRIELMTYRCQSNHGMGLHLAIK
jgi:hypothetical protein